MLHSVWVIGVALAFSASVYAKGIYKCVSPAGTAYQSDPCATGSEELLATTTTADSLARPGSELDNATHDASSQVAEVSGGLPRESRESFPSGRDTLMLGVTDDQALNTPGWGPPKKIIRHRERTGWREMWTYAPRAGGAPQLEFFNGRLVAISVQLESAATARMVSLSVQ